MHTLIVSIESLQSCLECRFLSLFFFKQQRRQMHLVITRQSYGLEKLLSVQVMDKHIIVWISLKEVTSRPEKNTTPVYLCAGLVLV